MHGDEVDCPGVDFSRLPFYISVLSISQPEISHFSGSNFVPKMRNRLINRLFPFPDVAHIVIAVWEGPATQLGIFDRLVDGESFVGRRLEARPD